MTERPHDATPHVGSDARVSRRVQRMPTPVSCTLAHLIDSAERAGGACGGACATGTRSATRLVRLYHD